MRIAKVTPVIATSKLKESKEFYTRHFGFDVIVENDWYILVRSRANELVELAFIQPNHESQPPVFQTAFAGGGVFYTLEVADAASEYDRLRNEGVQMALGLRDEPWGERHFAVTDPNDIPVNVSQLIPPSEEYAQQSSG